MEDGSHLTLLCKTKAGYTNLCRLLTKAHAGTRPRPGADPLPPVTTLHGAGGERQRLGVPLRLRPKRRRGAGYRGRTPCGGGGGRAAAAGHLQDRPADRAPAPLRPQRPPPQPPAGRAGGADRGADGGHRQRALPQPRAHPAPGRDGGRADGPHARRVRAPAPRQLLARARAARGHGGPLRRAPGGGGGVGPAGRAAGLRHHQRPRLHLPRLGGPRGRPQAGRGVLRTGSASATPAGARASGRAPGSTRSCA